MQPFHSTSFDDEIAALTLQLEEIGVHAQSGKGKYAVDHLPDSNVAYASFQAELQQYQIFLEDQKLARSIGTAVYSDGPAIADLAAEDIRCHEDRLFALQISNDELDYQNPPRSIFGNPSGASQNSMLTATKNQFVGPTVNFSDGNDEARPGPSKSFAEPQANVLDKPSKQFKCIVCYENFDSKSIVGLPCHDRWCVQCLKSLFLLATKDETRHPVKCHNQPIPLRLISPYMSPEELAAFELASVEFSTADRVYCSNYVCGQFIPPAQIKPGRNEALCNSCNTSTCALCKSNYHHGMDCPEDHALQTTRDLAGEMGWQTCYKCQSVVMLKTGCFHMT